MPVRKIIKIPVSEYNFRNGGVFLKKLLFFLVILSTLFLSGCVQRDLTDIYVFSERFAKHSKNFEIDTHNLTAKEEDSVLKFPLTFGNKFLLCVNVSDDTSLVTSFSITYIFDEKRELSEKDFSDFIELADSSIKAFTNTENTDKIFTALAVKNENDLIKDNHTSFEKGFYKYPFVSNEIGFYFTSSTERR